MTKTFCDKCNLELGPRAALMGNVNPVELCIPFRRYSDAGLPNKVTLCIECDKSLGRVLTAWAKGGDADVTLARARA